MSIEKKRFFFFFSVGVWMGPAEVCASQPNSENIPFGFFLFGELLLFPRLSLLFTLI
jgi:hypothetical protein